MIIPTQDGFLLLRCQACGASWQVDRDSPWWWFFTSGLEGRSETTRFRSGSISQVWEPEVFPQKRLFSLCWAISPSCWPGRRKHPPHALSVASVLRPALGLVLLCSPWGGATRLPVSRTEVQPKYSSKGQSSFSFHLELCDWAGRCREDGNIFKALFSCPNSPSCRSVSAQAQGASLGGGHSLLVLQPDVLDPVIDFLARTKVG